MHPSDDHDESPFDLPEEKSKSQLKREVEALQALGERLLAYPPKKLETIDMPEDLRAALLEAQRIKSHGALRRQLQYIGKLMRKADPAPIEDFLARQENQHQQQIAQQHRVERWRDRLLREGDPALEELRREAPAAELQQLRQLLRNAKHEQETGKPPKSSRALYQMLKRLLG
ncbi:MAG: ribosome biogenesis factor YjgA [Pseudomonadota bacterium]